MPKNKETKQMATISGIEDYDFLLGCATEVVKYIGSLDPAWEERIIAVRDERHFNDLQLLGSLAGGVLERGDHLLVPHLDYFDAGFVPAHTSQICPYCNEEYQTDYAGASHQEVSCLEQHYAKLDKEALESTKDWKEKFKNPIE